MSKKIGVAVVGAGPAGQSHAFGLRNATMGGRLPEVEVELIAIVDTDLARAVDVASRYGFEKATDDLKQVITDPRVHAVSIAVPNFLAAGIIEDVVAARKAVLAEKPLGTNSAQAEHLAELAVRAGVITGVGFSYRRIPAMAAARKAVADGRIGEPLFAVGHFFADYALDPNVPMSWRFNKEASGGGTLHDMGTHVIDAMEFIIGPIQSVPSAQLRTTIQKRPLADGSGFGIVDNDDTMMATLEHENGVLSSLAVSRIASGKPCEMGFTVFGTGGYVSFDFSRMGELEIFENGVDAEGLDGPRRAIAGVRMPHFADVMPMAGRGSAPGYGEAFVAQAAEFLSCVVEGREMDTNFAAAAATMRVAEAIESASSGGGPVTVAH